jgi:DNA-binding IclR family transcriptional regulator
MEGATVHSPSVRVLDALHDHTDVSIIAVAADLEVSQALIVLHDLAKRGFVERYEAHYWGLA